MVTEKADFETHWWSNFKPQGWFEKD